MSRPASLRPSSSPILARKKEKGSQKLGLDWEHIELSNNHKANTEYNILELLQLRRELIAAEESGRHSAVRRIRREISRAQENQLGIHSTWCGGCGNYLHNCRCQGLEAGSRSTKYRKRKNKAYALQVLHRILDKVHNDILAEKKAQSSFDKEPKL